MDERELWENKQLWESRGLRERLGIVGENCGKEWNGGKCKELWESRGLWQTQGLVGQCRELCETNRLLDNIGNYRRWDYGKTWRIVGENGGF